MSPKNSFAPNARRLLAISWALGGAYRAFRKWRKGASAGNPPEAFVRTLIKLGPAFVKLGQVLSTRPDILPPPYVDALSILQENAPEVPIEDIRATIQQEFGRAADELFATFDPSPVAAASLSQVHRATLPDGTAVAVKVRRPDVERLITRDLDALEFGLGVAQRLFPRRLARTNLRAFLTEFRRYTLNELDFAREGEVIDRFRANFAQSPEVRLPGVHWRCSGKRVLTTDWVEGMRVHEAAQALNPETKEALVVRLVNMLVQMFVSDGLFHADLHPGNIFFHEDGSFTLLDFGMYGELTPVQQDRFILYLFAVVQQQTSRAFHHFKAQTTSLPDAEDGAFASKFAALADRFYASPLAEMSFAKVYLEMMKAGYDFGFTFPSQLMLHAKALTTAEALIFVLAPDARFEKLARPVVAQKYAERTTSLELLKRRASQLLPELLLLGELPPPDAVDDAWDQNATAEILAELRDRVEQTVQRTLEQGGFWRTLLEPHIRAVLKGGELDDRIDEILKALWVRYYELEPDVPIQPTLGAVFTTHAAAGVLALHEILVEHGLSDAQSYELIHRIGWRVYTHMGEPPLLIASAFTRDPWKRLKLATDMFRAFPFGAPSYQWRDMPASDGAVAFDCLKCPVAEFFAQHNASELCVQTFCQLDFPLAEKWGGQLQRTGTIASGAPRCDFRWRAGRPATVGGQDRSAEAGKRTSRSEPAGTISK